MSFFRSLLLLCFFSGLAALCLFFTGYKLNYNQYSGGYAVLTADESVMDKTLLDFLTADSEPFSESILSESSQWVLLDEFGALSQIPLEEYSGRVMPFDPRNDGYAGKLKNFFVSGGKRFVFIPIEPGFGSPVSMEKRIAGLLGDIPFSVDFFGLKKPLFVFFIFFAAAALGMIVLFCLMKNDRTCIAGIVPCLFVLSALSFFGQAGLALAALLLGLAVLLWEPLFEFCVIHHVTLSAGKERQRRLARDVYEPYRLYLFFLPLFPAAFIFIMIYSGVLPLFTLAVVGMYSVIFFKAAWTLSLPAFYRRFRPVLIVKRRFPDFAFSIYMLPFLLAVFCAAFFSHQAGEAAPGNDFNTFSFSGRTVTEAEYYDHLSFQASFSQRSMDREGAAYPDYSIGDDGLISPSFQAKTTEFYDFADFPPFPLKDLMIFIDNHIQPAAAGAAPMAIGIKKASFGSLTAFMPFLIILIFLLPGLFMRRKIMFVNSRPSALKGISGRKRLKQVQLKWGDKKRKKILLLMNKADSKYILEPQPVKQNSVFVRKDA